MSLKPAQTFEDVALCHLDLVFRMALRLTGSSHEAEDLTQETFFKAQRAFPKFDLREYGAKPWLLRILHNVFFTRCGQSAKAPSLLEDLSLDDFAAELEREPLLVSVTAEIDWDRFDEELKRAVLSLPPEYRSVIVLWALGDLTYKEISVALGCAIGTVMSRLFRARQQLSEALGEYAVKRGIRPKKSVNS